MYTAQSLFYYPYGSFKDKQSPILRAAALYFDRLFILDPEKASAGVIGAEPILDDLDLLKKEGILVPVAPETVLGGLSGEISKAVQDDLKDEGFLQLCRRAGQASRWTIALSKLPDDKKLDEAVKSFMRDQARSAGTRKNANVPVYDETAMTALGRRDYRYADFPLELGESIMINHALFASLLLKKATPITDDAFHDKALKYKIERELRNEKIMQVVEDRSRSLLLAQTQFAAQALTDKQLSLPMLKLPLSEILEYRRANEPTLLRVREDLAWLAREIESQPLTKDFDEEIDHTVIPNLRRTLSEVEKARDSWLNGKKGKLALKAAGVVVGLATGVATLALGPTLLTMSSMALSLGGIFAGNVVPALDLIGDWKKKKAEAQGKSLRYLLTA